MLWTGSAALAAAVLLGLFVAVMSDEAGLVDRGWHDLMAAWRPEALLVVSQALNAVGGGWIAVFVVPLAIAAALLIARRPRSAVFALAAFAASAVLVQLLKQLFARDRPDGMLVLSDFGSFPSGHTANAATIAVVLLVLFPRAWVGIVGAAWVLLMALSRTVLAVHWLTDTVGGALAGVAAAALIAAALAPWFRSAAPDRVERPDPS